MVWIENSSLIDPRISPVRNPAGVSHLFGFKGAAITVQLPSGAAQNLNKPSTGSGDLMVVDIHTNQPPTPTGWTALQFSTIHTYFRVANGTATDEFAIDMGNGGDQGRLCAFAAWSAPAAGVTLLRSGVLKQVGGPTRFIETALLADAGFTQTIAVCGCSRTGSTPAVTPSYSNPGAVFQLAAQAYQDWNDITPSVRFSYIAITYILEQDADAVTETDLVYSPFEGGATDVTQGRTYRFRET